MGERKREEKHVLFRIVQFHQDILMFELLLRVGAFKMSLYLLDIFDS